jgi:hypothetical protein
MIALETQIMSVLASARALTYREINQHVAGDIYDAMMALRDAGKIVASGGSDEAPPFWSRVDVGRVA